MAAYLTSQTGILVGCLSSEGSLTGTLSTTLPDGGYERGYSEGYDEALSKRTDLTITENGEYIPEDYSTGFKSVKANVKFNNKLPQVVSQTVTEITASDLEGATRINRYAFYMCQNLTSVEFPSTLTSIDMYAFNYATKLNRIYITENITYLGAYAFAYCSGVQSVEFAPNSKLATIGVQAFQGLKPLTEVTIPSLVTKMDYGVFWQCTNLTSVVMKPKNPPVASADLFRDCKALVEIIVPVGSGAAYKAATNWSAYGDKIVEENV